MQSEAATKQSNAIKSNLKAIKKRPESIKEQSNINQKQWKTKRTKKQGGNHHKQSTRCSIGQKAEDPRKNTPFPHTIDAEIVTTVLITSRHLAAKG